MLDAFLLRSLAVAGYAPALDECAVRAADPAPAGPRRRGGRACRAAADRASSRCGGRADLPVLPAAGAATPSVETIALMSALLRGDWAQADAASGGTR